MGPAPFWVTAALVRAVLNAEAARLTNMKVIFSQKPKFASSLHFGCRIVESRAPGINGKSDGKLFLAFGERYSRSADEQTLTNHHGKIIRVNKVGSVPPDNLFFAKAVALPEIWSYTHRDPQALAPDSTL